MKNYVVKVLDQEGYWSDEATVRNLFHAIEVAKLYRDKLGFCVMLYQGKNDLTALIDTADMLWKKTSE